MSEKERTAGVDLDALKARMRWAIELANNWTSEYRGDEEFQPDEFDAVADQLRAARAVVPYARHTADCAVENDTGYHGKPICDCGFDRLTGERQ